MGQSVKEDEHVVQQQRCPHGKKIIWHCKQNINNFDLQFTDLLKLTMLSIHITHSEVVALCNISTGGALASSGGGADGFVSTLLRTG